MSLYDLTSKDFLNTTNSDGRAHVNVSGKSSHPGVKPVIIEWGKLLEAGSLKIYFIPSTEQFCKML